MFGFAYHDVLQTPQQLAFSLFDYDKVLLEILITK